MEAMADAHWGHDIVVVGASAGGVEALRSLVTRLPADLGASVFVVLHLPPSGTSVLPRILERCGVLPVSHAKDGEAFQRARIYVAPPDQHMRIADGVIRLDRGPKVNGHRPAVDPTFRSAADLYGGRVTGVVLSGVLDDGAAGLGAITSAGGEALVQSPEDALYPTMPQAAMAVVPGAFVASAEDLAGRIVELTSVPSGGPPAAVGLDPADEVVRYLEVERGATEAPQIGEPSGFTCPDCHGGLWESDEGGVRIYRCRTGHEYSEESLAALQSEHVERALWAGLRALEEKAAMLRRMSVRLDVRGGRLSAARLAHKAESAVEQAVVLRNLLQDLDGSEELQQEQTS
jgi:two-component system, chemotaxis family, protein-glutamate methylesterase/glutaminase